MLMCYPEYIFVFETIPRRCDYFSTMFHRHIIHCLLLVVTSTGPLHHTALAPHIQTNINAAVVVCRRTPTLLPFLPLFPSSSYVGPCSRCCYDFHERILTFSFVIDNRTTVNYYNDGYSGHEIGIEPINPLK